MRWQHAEFILKGIFLGLLVFIALQQPTPTWHELAYIGGATLGGLVLFVGIAAVRKLREGYRVRGRIVPFLLFLLLENPSLVYAGVLLGLLGGTLYVFYFLREGRPDQYVFIGSIVGGAVLGTVFHLLRNVEKKQTRFFLGMALAAVLVSVVIGALQYRAELLSEQQRFMMGCLLLMGIPVFYLLTFASMVEESEAEIAAMCAALGIGSWLLTESYFQEQSRIAFLVMAAVVYYVYTRQILPGLRVFKHVLRAMSYASVGHYRWALLSLRRALQLEPKNKLALEELWQIHRSMDFEQIVNDPQTLELVDFEMCHERAATLLLNPPKTEELDEAVRLLDLVAGQRPDMLPRCDYWRAVAAIHKRDYDGAAEHLERVLAGDEADMKNPHRWAILLMAWQLALGHKEMKRLVGTPQLEQPKRRMEAIAAVERHLAENSEDTTVWEMKRQMYHELSEADYDSAVVEGAKARHFDHGYVRELGMALINDSTRWQRGAEYLRIAARGLPEVGPSLFVSIAKASEKAQNYKGAWDNYELAKQVGHAAGPDNLSKEDRTVYFQVVKMLADSARDDGEVDKAIENYRLLLESPDIGAETYRALAELYEKKGDVWSAVHATEHALIHAPKNDQDLKERKDRYYFSIEPDELRKRWDEVQKWFDINYCINTAKSALNQPNNDLDTIDWAGHLMELGYVAQPSNMSVRLQRARVRWFKGEIATATEMLEQIRTDKPEKFASAEDEESWYFAVRMLGEIYLPDKAQEALECFVEYKTYPKSGANTYYKMGQCYEALGDWPRAYKCYEQVTAYENHPLYYDAREALDRLRQGSAS